MEIIVTTLGKDGSLCYIREGDIIRQGKDRNLQSGSCVDATGSGDAYMAGFIYGYLKGYKAEECCRLGGTLSYFILQSEGCCTNAPTEEQLLEKAKTFE